LIAYLPKSTPITWVGDFAIAQIKAGEMPFCKARWITC